ncbi:hypothetical protein [Pseudogemmobacter humi]|nr:hypothetical protein [Pseudogemmobacter humi]
MEFAPRIGGAAAENPVLLELSGEIGFAGASSLTLTIQIDRYIGGVWSAFGNLGKVYMATPGREFVIRTIDKFALGFLGTVDNGRYRLSVYRPAGITSLSFQSTIFTVRQISK